MNPLRCCTALAALALLPAAVALAQPAAAPPSHATARTPQLTAEPARVEPGETLELTGRSFPRDARLALLARSADGEVRRIGSAQTGRRGRFVATIRIRERSSAGAFVAQACFDACRVKATARFRIVTP